MSSESLSGVRRLLPKIVQVFVALATPPMRIIQTPKLLEDLDSIIQCVPNLKDQRLSRVLIEIAHGNDDEILKLNIMRINHMVTDVVEFLTGSYEIKYDDNLPPVLGIAIRGLLVLGGQVKRNPTDYIFNKGFLIPDYQAMLKLAIQEAHQWRACNMFELPENTEATLEAILLKEVECSGRKLTEMIERIRKFGGRAEDIAFRSPDLEGATLESKSNLLLKMQIVAKTIHMFIREVQDMKLVGVVGAEDAGKSTFIRKAIQRFGGSPDPDVPKVGCQYHTSTVRAYKFSSDGKIYLVDFPGSDGTGANADAWKQFTSLPSSCVLLLDFKNDIKKEQVEMYQNMKTDLASKVIVVFNKVDEKFTPRREAEYCTEYFLQQRQKSARQLGCKTTDVHFACLDPEPEEKLDKLREVGVIGLEELVQIALSPSE